jgi:hypothetical protein
MRLCADKERGLLANFTAFVNGAFASGRLDDRLRAIWGSCVTLALTKRAGGFRPISMGAVERRCAGRAGLHTMRIEKRFRGENNSHCLQLGCFTKNGSEHAVHDLNLHIQLHPDHVLLHTDVSNAFNSQSRFAFLQQVRIHFPELLHLAAQF